MSILTLYYIIPVLAGLTVAFVVAATYYTFQTRKEQLSRDKSILSNAIVGRKKEMIRLRGHILTGQSGAIVSVFEEDRTALLGYLSDPSHSKELYGEQADKLVFSLLDIYWLLQKEGEKECQPVQFWEHALKPLEDELKSHPSLFQIYQTCKENQFDEYYLDKLIVQLKQEGWRLVLMLDRFDELLNSNLYKPAFFATLRKLASSRSPSSLSLIISGNISLKQFHEQTKKINPKGSPYLNFIESGEMMLGNLSDSEIDKLLSEMSFSKPERQFIQDIAGGHPHFLQIAASALQLAKETQEEQPLEMAKKDFYGRVESMLTNIMHSWNLEVCQAIVALVKENKPLEFFNDELSLLEKQGFLVKDSQNQWQVSPHVLVDFINSKTGQELCNH
jgi:hypothetical protein